ncbi:MAG TPA: DUF374 domain-containing protein [Bacteroidetes bacterium]|nr:DUF374 domain-containing protein [Bacteroidota bacterium]
MSAGEGDREKRREEPARGLGGAFVPEQPAGIWARWLPPLVGAVVPPLIRAWGRTLSLELAGLEHLRAARRTGPVIFAVWHGRISLPIYVLRKLDFDALVSPVWEAELIARLLHGMGYGLIRASDLYHPARGALACVRSLRRGRSLAVVVDGPEGPPHVVKPGVVAIAALSGRPILPMLGVGERTWRLPTWDSHQVPHPFRRAVFGFGPPLEVPRRLAKGEMESWTRRVGEALRALDADLRERIGAGGPDG